MALLASCATLVTIVVVALTAISDSKQRAGGPPPASQAQVECLSEAGVRATGSVSIAILGPQPEPDFGPLLEAEPDLQGGTASSASTAQLPPAEPDVGGTTPVPPAAATGAPLQPEPDGGALLHAAASRA